MAEATASGIQELRGGSAPTTDLGEDGRASGRESFKNRGSSRSPGSVNGTGPVRWRRRPRCRRRRCS